jgi:hypothetical protein
LISAVTLFVAVSIRTTVAAPSQAIQTEPSPSVVPFGPDRTSTVAMTWPSDGSIRRTSELLQSVAHTASVVAAT